MFVYYRVQPWLFHAFTLEVLETEGQYIEVTKVMHQQHVICLVDKRVCSRFNMTVKSMQQGFYAIMYVYKIYL